MRGIAKTLFLVALIVATVIIVRQQRSTPYHQHTDLVFGTVYNVSYQHSEDLKGEIDSVLHQVDSALSMFNPSSVIARINGGDSLVPASPQGAMFMDVCRLAMQVSDDTHGAFDITVAPLVNAWGFGFKSGEHPSQHTIDSLRRFVGYQLVQLIGRDDRSVVRRRDSRTMLDCSAIAKGYGTDCVARLLRQRGVENFMVEIGGEVVTCGVSPKRLPWRIGVEKPTDDTLVSDRSELQTVLNVTNRAMATSGNYRNFYYRGGRKYAHTIDPRTGCPVQHSLLSATVLADDCATADAYATAFMVVGLDSAKAILGRHSELMAYLIYQTPADTLGVWASPQLNLNP